MPSELAVTSGETRERYAREFYAAFLHDRPIRVCRRPPAASNINGAKSTPQQRAYVHGVPVASEMRESITRTMLRCLSVRPSHPILFHIRNPQFRDFADGGADLHDANGFVQQNLCRCFIRRVQTTQV